MAINDTGAAKPPSIIMYGHAICPDVPPLKALLNHARVTYAYVDIRKDPLAASRVREINGGNESVPTFVFPDGSTLTEPSVPMLTQKLNALGYRVGPLAMLAGNAKWIVIGAAALIALLRAFGVF